MLCSLAWLFRSCTHVMGAFTVIGKGDGSEQNGDCGGIVLPPSAQPRSTRSMWSDATTRSGAPSSGQDNAVWRGCNGVGNVSWR